LSAESPRPKRGGEMEALTSANRRADDLRYVQNGRQGDGHSSMSRSIQIQRIQVNQISVGVH
jgi:hypothetical protein